MYYYQVALLKSSAPQLTYFSLEKISIGQVVEVPLKSTIKEAIILNETIKPEFKTQELKKGFKYYSLSQIEIAKFISQYYFSSFGEAISLFLPFEKVAKPTNFTTNKVPILNKEQKEAFDKLKTKDKALLFGVTGAGKTEIFISLMIEVLKKEKNIIFLMPEISLTPQMKSRLKNYFGSFVEIWHSKLTKKKKESILEGIFKGDIRIIAGARSSLFVPLNNIGLIIVDEEHDDSYKAISHPRYHARDSAILMASKLKAQILLASATPSVASYYKYDVIKISKPFIETKKEYEFISGNSINSKIISEIRAVFENKKQSLLFLPTRGNFKYLYCKGCGKTHLCPYCSVGMAIYRNYKHLRCHYCNYVEAIRESCVYCGYAPLESQRIGTVEAIELINSCIKDIKIEQFDKEAISTQKKLKDALKRFESKESNMLLGTQMLSKGHDYPNIVLSLIMGLDYILGIADYRAKERAISLFFQIAGRSGRNENAKIIIQTQNEELFTPYLKDYELFLKDELEFLKIGNYPPFSTLARVLIANRDDHNGLMIMQETLNSLRDKEVEIVGYGKAPIEKIANKYRFHILLRSKKRVPLLKILNKINNPKIEIDFDPINFS